MKKSFFVLTVFILSAVFFFGCSDNSDEKNDTGKEITANIDEEVKKVFNLTNSFRTGNEAFYLNENNSSTTNLVGQLGTLTLDEGLCKAAQIRANEIVSNFFTHSPERNELFHRLKRAFDFIFCCWREHCCR